MAKPHVGIVTFGVLGILFGIVGMVSNGLVLLMVMAVSNTPVKLNPTTIETLKMLQGPASVSIVLNVLTAFLMFVAGIGLFGLKRWAKTSYLVAAGFTIASRLAFFPLHFTRVTASGVDTMTQTAQQGGAIAGDLAVIVFNVLVFWFLSRANIKALFQAPSRPSSR